MNRASPLLQEGAHRLSVCRLANAFSGRGRRRISSTSSHARRQEPQLNFQNRHRIRLPSYAHFPSLNGGSGNSMFEWHRSTLILALGGANYDACPTRSFMNDWKYCRCFVSDAKDSSNVKPDPATQVIRDGDIPKKAPKTIIVPKEYIDALKSEVDEMESSTPSTIQRTQEDFAEYLIGPSVDHENLLKSSTSASEAPPRAHGTTPDSNKENEKIIATDSSGAFPVYHKFSSSDALVRIASLPRFVFRFYLFL